MKCGNCGRENVETAKVCAVCGKDIGSSTYEFVADKVGLVPNLRASDNLFQAIFVAVFILLGAIIGFIYSRSTTGLLVGVLGGLIVGGLLSGLVLMIRGLMRK